MNGENYVFQVLLWSYLVVGFELCRRWDRFEESSKSFLLLFFPAHTFFYLVWTRIGPARLWQFLRTLLLLALLYLLFRLGR